MKIIDITKQLPFKRSNGKMKADNIKFTIVHHSAHPVTGPYNSLNLYKSYANLHISKGWGHISYHYIIDNVGDIYQCLPENEVGYHCGNFATNKSSIAIMLDGNFETQTPLPKQEKSLINLLNWLHTKRPDLPKLVKSTTRGHREIKATSCPGKNLFKVVLNYRNGK